MTDRADLHIHTTASGDALNEPEKVFRQAERLGLKAISFTNHDNVLHNGIGRELSRKYPVKFVPGVEVSSSWKKQVAHVLGYFSGDALPSLVSFLDKAGRNAARKKAVGLIAKMREMGYDVTLEEYDETARKCNTGDSPLLRLMVRKNHVKDIADFRKKFDRINYEDTGSYSPCVITSIDEIHKAGGIAVIAHPAGNRETSLVKLGASDIEEMVANGLDGIEVFHELNNAVDREIYLDLAARHNLMVTGGSDSHGLEGLRPLGSNCCDWLPMERKLAAGSRDANGKG